MQMSIALLALLDLHRVAITTSDLIPDRGYSSPHLSIKLELRVQTNNLETPACNLANSIKIMHFICLLLYFYALAVWG